jgi:hypothetical protein
MPATETRPTEAPTDLRRCDNCGRMGREGVDVLTAWYWVGGKGDVLRTFCTDQIECWKRRQQSHR